MAALQFKIGTEIKYSLNLSISTYNQAINNITNNKPGFGVFTANQIAYYNSTDSNSKYVTWRSVDISAQPSGGPNYLNVYPTAGFSLDIWSSNFYNAVNGSSIWSDINQNEYALSTTKNSVLYDYDKKTALYYQKGGTIKFNLF